MRRLRRARRPLIALVALVIALVIGYLARSSDSGHHGLPVPVRPVTVQHTGTVPDALVG